MEVFTLMWLKDAFGDIHEAYVYYLHYFAVTWTFLWMFDDKLIKIVQFSNWRTKTTLSKKRLFIVYRC